MRFPIELEREGLLFVQREGNLRHLRTLSPRPDEGVQAGLYIKGLDLQTMTELTQFCHLLVELSAAVVSLVPAVQLSCVFLSWTFAKEKTE